MNLLIALFIVTCVNLSAAYAEPIYMAKVHQPDGLILLNFFDAPTNPRAGYDRGNVAAFHLGMGNKVARDLFYWQVDIPFYMSTGNATLGDSETNFGNLNGSVEFEIPLSQNSEQENRFDPARTWGVRLGSDFYAPTSRAREAMSVSMVQPTTDYFRYYPHSYAVSGRVTGYFDALYWSARSTGAYVYQFVTADSGNPTRNNFTWQNAASIHMLPILHLNLEYNAMIVDAGSTYLEGSDTFRHAVAPSVSSTLGPVELSAFLTFPLDEATQGTTNYTVGLIAGTQI